MIGESAVVIGSSLYVFYSFFELKQCAGYILFHVVREYHSSGVLFLLGAQKRIS